MKYIPLFCLIFSLTCQKQLVYSQEPIEYGFLRDTVNEHIYKTIKLGNQEWMAENLRSSKYRDGREIELIYDQAVWDSTETPAYSFYNNEFHNIQKYGFLYNYYVLEDSAGLCPAGWKIPGSHDWEILIKQLGGESLSGEKLKDHTQGKWKEGAIGKFTEVGFGAVPGGYRDAHGDYHDEGMSANFWSNTSIDAVTAETYDLEFDFTSLLRGLEDKKHGLSVRCIKE